MAETKNNDKQFPEVKPTKPGNDAAYIAPIIGKLGYDTRRPWLFGLGTSPNNGVDFHVFLSFDGLNFDDNDIDKIWNGGTADKVKKEVDSATAEIPAAVSAANSAVSAAESAVAASKVNSDAIVAQSAAISEAKSAISSATAAIQQTAANAASDAAKIRADVAKVQNEVDTAKTANSASVEALKSDVSAAKQDIQAARQANENFAKQLDDYTKQAQAQGKTIKDIQDAQDGYTATLADVKGNVSKISNTVDGLSASLKDGQDNVATIKAKADELSATLTDHDKNIAQLTDSVKELSSTLEDAGGRLSKVEQTATALSSDVSDQQGRISKVEQKATGTEQTVANQQGQINDIKTDAAGIHETLTGQGNQIANINVTLGGLSTKYDGVSGDLSKLSDKVTTNSTQIDQDKKLIALKADQTTVNNLSGEVSHNAAQLKVQADQISSKVSSDDFKTLDNKVGGAITQIQKNSTAIDQTNKQISLKADQTEVDKIKNTATQNSSRLDVMAGQIQSKVTSTDVNNIVDSKGYATTSTVQSLITQKAGTINENITNLTNEMNTRNGVNLLKGTKDFSGSWHNYGSTNYWHTENWIDPNGNHSVKSDSLSGCGYYQPIYLDTGDYTFSGYYYSEGGKPVFCYLRPNSGDNLVEVSYNSNLDSTPNGWRWFVVHFKVTKAGNAAVRLESGRNQILHIASYKLERGTVANPVWTPAPSDNATVTQVQQITASIDGLQSTVSNKADKSQITQLSNVIQSKVSSSDFNDLKDKTLWKSTNSIDLNTAVSQQKIFVKGGSNLPPGPYWWYVQVEPGYHNRIVQYAVSGRDNKHYSRQYNGAKWSAWSLGATESEITQLSNDINLRVTKDDLLGQINIQAGNTLIQNGRIYLDANSIVFGKNSRAIIPSAAIGNLDAAKITTGSISVPMSDGKDNSISFEDDGVVIKSKGKSSDFYDANEGTSKLKITGAGIEFISSTDNDESIKRLGIMTPTTYQNVDTSGMTFVVTGVGDSSSGTLNDRGAFFSLARKTLSYPLDYKGMIYATGEMGDLDTGFHFNDPVYIHPYGAETGIRSTWCSWSSMGNRKFPVLVNSDHGWSGIAFPIWGQAFVFSNNGYVARPNQKIDSYSGYGEGNRDYFDSTDPNQKH